MVEESKTLHGSDTPWKRHYERACQLANASIQTYVQSSAHMVLNLKDASVPRSLPTFRAVTRALPSRERREPLVTHNIFGDPLQIPSEDVRGFSPPGVEPAGFAPRRLADDDSQAISKVQTQPNFATVVSSAQRITELPSSTVQVPDYLSRPPAVQLGLVVDDEVTAAEYLQVRKLGAATRALENLSLFRQERDRAHLLQTAINEAAEGEVLSWRREQGLHSRDPLAAIRRIDDAIGNRVPCDAWRGGVLPSLGADMRYSLISGLHPKSVTNVAMRWFGHKKANGQKEVATEKAGDEKEKVKELPEYLPMLHQLCQQTMRLEQTKKAMAAQREARHSVVIKGGVLPVEEEKPGPPALTMISQRGLKTVVDRLDSEASPPPPRLPRKPKTTKELGTQTEAPRAPPPAAKSPSAATMLQAPAKAHAAKAAEQFPARECVALKKESPGSTEDSSSEASEATETPKSSIAHLLHCIPTTGEQLYAELQGKEKHGEAPSEQASESEAAFERNQTDEKGSSVGVARQQPESWFCPAMWSLMQQSMYIPMGIPNPMGPPSLQRPHGEESEEDTFCGRPPVDYLASAFTPFAGGECTDATAIPDPQQVPPLQESISNEHQQQAGLPSWLYEEARRLFPPGFEQVLWESVSLSHPAISTAFPVVQFNAEDPTNPWQALAEEVHWQEQWRWYQQWQRHLTRQWQAYAETVSLREASVTEWQRGMGAPAEKPEAGKTKSVTERQPHMGAPAERCEVEKVTEEQKLLKQEIHDEFDTFDRTQQVLAESAGTRCFRGRAAIGNCRGGRRAWRIFDKVARTSTERTRQLRMEMLPEADDHFDVLPYPSLCPFVGEIRRLRGGLRRRSVRFESPHKRWRHRERAAEVSRKQSERHSDGSFEEGRKNSQDHSKRRHSRPRRIVLDDDVAGCQGKQRENAQILGASREPLDWYERQKCRLSRERKMDTFFDKVAERMWLPREADDKHAELLLTAVSPEEEMEGISEEAKRCAFLPLKPSSKLKNRMYASKRVTELKQLSGLLAVGKLPREVEELLRKRPQCFSKEQQVFVGLLNLDGCQRHTHLSCAMTSASRGGVSTHHSSEKHLGFQQSNLDALEGTTETKRGVEGEQVEEHEKAFGASQPNSERREAISCSIDADEEAGPWKPADCSHVAERPDGKASPCLRGRTLLDLSPATLFEAQTVKEENRGQAQAADNSVSYRADGFVGSCVSNVEAEAALLPSRQNLKMPFSENSSSVCGESSVVAGKWHASKTKSASLPTPGDLSRANSLPSDADSASGFQAASNATQLTASCNGDGETFEAKRHLEVCSRNSATCDTVSGRAFMRNKSLCAEYVQPQEGVASFKPFLAEHVGLSVTRPFLAVNRTESANTRATVHGSRSDSDRQTFPYQTTAFTVTRKTDKFGCMRRLTQSRTAAKNKPYLFSIRPQPTAFPWDEDVIPTCRKRTTDAIESCAEAYDTSQHVSNSDNEHPRLSKAPSTTGECNNMVSEALRRKLEDPVEEKHYTLFLRRRSGTGGGDYARENQHDRSQVTSFPDGGGEDNARQIHHDKSGVAPSQRESTCTVVPGTPFTNSTSATQLGNGRTSWPQSQKESFSVRSVCAEKAEFTSYLIERALTLADFGRQSSNARCTAEKVSQIVPHSQRLSTRCCTSMTGPPPNRSSQAMATRGRRVESSRSSDAVSVYDHCDGEVQSKRTSKSTISDQEREVTETIGIHLQRCLNLDEGRPSRLFTAAHASPHRTSSSKKRVRFENGLAADEQSNSAEERSSAEERPDAV